jgi:hypothetical protein
VCLPAGFIVKGIEDRKCTVVVAYREPSDRVGFGGHQRLGARQELRDLVFLAGFGFEFNVESKFRHRRLLIARLPERNLPLSRGRIE